MRFSMGFLSILYRLFLFLLLRDHFVTFILKDGIKKHACFDNQHASHNGSKNVKKCQLK
jgi:hypothetical protein